MGEGSQAWARHLAFRRGGSVRRKVSDLVNFERPGAPPLSNRFFRVWDLWLALFGLFPLYISQQVKGAFPSLSACHCTSCLQFLVSGLNTRVLWLAGGATTKNTELESSTTRLKGLSWLESLSKACPLDTVSSTTLTAAVGTYANTPNPDLWKGEDFFLVARRGSCLCSATTESEGNLKQTLPTPKPRTKSACLS